MVWKALTIAVSSCFWMSSSIFLLLWSGSWTGKASVKSKVAFARTSKFGALTSQMKTRYSRMKYWNTSNEFSSKSVFIHLKLSRESAGRDCAASCPLGDSLSLCGNSLQSAEDQGDHRIHTQTETCMWCDVNTGEIFKAAMYKTFTCLTLLWTGDALWRKIAHCIKSWMHALSICSKKSPVAFFHALK